MRPALAFLASVTALAAAEVTFTKQTITKDFVAEGCAVADFNHDGQLDVAAGRFLWLGPDFKEKVAYTPERNNAGGPSKTPYNPSTGYSDYFIQFAYDFTGDGWMDLLVFGLPGEPAFVFVNPAGKGGDWARHNIFDVADGESPAFVDVNGDGKPELLCHSSDLVKPKTAKGGKSGGQFGYAEIDWNNPLGKARFRPITPKTPANDQKIFKYTHGYGAGDVNGDGLPDIVTGKRRWAHGPKGDDEPMADPVVYWFELKRDGKGGASYMTHQVDRDSGIGTQFWTGPLTPQAKPAIVTANKHGVFVFTQK